jgi:glycosyltransferase involved in cell wall biosynthesis
LLGELDRVQLERVRSGAAVQLAPSRCEEQSPYAVLEAMAGALPVLVSQMGGLPELAGADASLPPRDATAWAQSLAELWAQPQERRRQGDSARARAWARAAPAPAHAALMGVYQRAGADLDASAGTA